MLWLLTWAVYSIEIWFREETSGVYGIFAAASRHWWAGLSMYGDYPPLDIFRYHPSFSILFSPFGLLPRPIGATLWNLVSLVALFASLRLAVRRLFPWRWTERQEGVFLLLALGGTLRGYWSAQTNAILLALLLFAAVAILDGRWWRAAWLMTVPVFIKVWPIAFVLLVATCWPRRLVPRLVLPAATLAALPFLFAAPARALSEYAAYFAILERTAPLRWRGYRDGWTIWEQLGTVDPEIYLALQLAGAALVLAWCTWVRAAAPGARVLLTATFFAWTTWQLLLGPGTERLTYGLIAPFTAAAVVVSFARGRLRGLALSAWLLTVILGAGEAERALDDFFPPAPAIQPAGVAVFAVWVAAYPWRRLRVSEARSASE